MSPSDTFADDSKVLMQNHSALLLQLAKASIESGLAGNGALQPDPANYPAELTTPGAVFVTLKRSGNLRGCIGSPQAHLPLIEDVCENAFRAAFADPRFPPLRAEETGDDLTLSISLLSPSSPMTISSEQDLLAQLVAGRDGLIIEDGPYKALFLPAVWEQLPAPADFVGQLKAKAGMGLDHWSPSFRASRFIALETKAAWHDIYPLGMG